MSETTLLALLIGYVIAIAFVTWRARRYNVETGGGYTIGNRQTSPFGVGASIVVSIWDPNGFVILLTLIISIGFGIWWLMGGVIIGTLAYMVVAPRLNRLAHQFHYRTAADLIYDRMGRKTWIVMLICASLALFSSMGMGVKLLGLMLSAGFEDYGISVPIGSALILIFTVSYMWVSGYKSVIGTDKLQFLLTLIVALAGFWMLFTSNLNISFDRITSELKNAPSSLSLNIMILIAILNFVYLDTWQRGMSAKSPQGLQSGISIAVISLMIIYAGLTFLGLGLIQNYPDIFTGEIMADVNQFIMEVIRNPEIAWFSPFFIAAMLALGMSTLDSRLFHVSGMLVHALGINAEEDKGRAVTITRIVIVTLAIGVYLLSNFIPNVLEWAVNTVGLFAVFAPFMAIAIYVKASSLFYDCAMALALALGVIIWGGVFMHQTFGFDTAPILSEVVNPDWLGLMPFAFAAFLSLIALATESIFPEKK